MGPRKNLMPKAYKREILEDFRDPNFKILNQKLKEVFYNMLDHRKAVSNPSHRPKTQT